MAEQMPRLVIVPSNHCRGLGAGLLSRESAEAGRLNAKREAVASVIDMRCRLLLGLHMRGKALHMRSGHARAMLAWRHPQDVTV